LRSGVAELSSHDVEEWHGDALSDRLVTLLELRERLDAEVTRVAAVWATLSGVTPDLAKMRCDLDGIGPITTAALEQLKCGATLRRLVMAGDSIVLDMGRKTRLATATQTRAIRIRDGGCTFPGCGRPPRWCDIHHVDDWASGGRTDVARMCCLCRRHQTLIHNSQWTITVEPDGTFRVAHPARAP
jgi:hypothetical protein